MRLLPVLAIVFLACILQVAAVPGFPILGLQPHLPLLLLVLWSQQKGTEEALALAIPAGLLLGLMSSGPLGVAIISLALAVLAARSPWLVTAAEEGLLSALGAVLIASAAYYLLEALILQGLGYPVPWWPSAFRQLVEGALVNALLAPLLYWPLQLGWHPPASQQRQVARWR